MRMYGREKIDVVKPTKAVSATRNTLNGSTKNSLPSANSRPVRHGLHGEQRGGGEGQETERRR